MQVVKSFPLVLLISFIPILMWALYFYYKNPRKQPPLEIFRIFLLGMFSLIPVWFFHQWLLNVFIKKVEAYSLVLDHPFIFGLLELLLVALFILFFILLFSLLHSSQLKFFYRLNWYQSFMTIYKRLYNLTPILFFLFAFIVVELLFSFTRSESFILSLLGTTLMFSILEEYFKYIINPFLVYKKINSVGTAMVYALYVGLAFAFVENILFFYTHSHDENFLQIFAYRSLFTTLMHVGTSGVIGYFYGLSIFGESILKNYEIEKSKYGIPVWLQSFLKKTTVYKSLLITQGFFLASLIHALFNLMIYLNLLIPAAIVVIFLTLVILFLLNSSSSQIQYALIGTPAMPEEDFERLRLQISVLQHVKEIQKSHSNPSEKS